MELSNGVKVNFDSVYTDINLVLYFTPVEDSEITEQLSDLGFDVDEEADYDGEEEVSSATKYFSLEDLLGDGLKNDTEVQQALELVEVVDAVLYIRD